MLSTMMLRDVLEQPSYHHGFLPELLYGGDNGGEYYLNPHVHLSIVKPRLQTSLDFSQLESKTDLNKFQVMLNVKHFSPSEIDVKTVDDEFVVIHCQHEEHADERSFISREFTRRYKLPEDVEPQKVTSVLSKDGILIIQAPRKTLEPPPKNERIIPITIQQPSMVEEAHKIEQAVNQAAAVTSEDQNNVELEKVTSALSKDYILIIQAPRKTLDPPPKNERIIPITIQQPSKVEEAHKIEQAVSQAEQVAAVTSEDQDK